MALIDGIVSYYKLDTNNSTQPDSVGSYPGTVTGALYTASGKINGCYDFDTAANDTIVTGVPLTKTYTWSIWAKQAGGSSYRTMMSVKSPITLLDFQNTLLKVVLSDRAEITVSSFATDTFYHVVLVREGDDTVNGYKVYVDGVLKGSYDSGVVTPGSDTLYIGSREGNGSQGWNGLLDEVAVFSSAKSQSEITELYNSGDGLQYPFSNTAELSGTNDITVTASGDLSAKISLSGTNNITVTASGNLGITVLMSGTNSISVTASGNLNAGEEMNINIKDSVVVDPIVMRSKVL